MSVMLLQVAVINILLLLLRSLNGFTGFDRSLLFAPVPVVWREHFNCMGTRFLYEDKQQKKCSTLCSIISSTYSTSRSCVSLAMSVDSDRQLRRIQLDDSTDEANAICRIVRITPDWDITVWEWENPASVIEDYWEAEQNQENELRTDSPPVNVSNNFQPTSTTVDGNQKITTMLDPFGLVVWPGSVIAAQEMLLQRQYIENKRILILGAGVGVEAQAAAQLGASYVLATDIHPTTIQLLRYGAQQSGYDHIIETAILDITAHDQKLPSNFDVIIIADVLYNDNLASHVAKRCVEVMSLNDSNSSDVGNCDCLEHAPIIVISDSQRFANNFESELNHLIETTMLARRQQQATLPPSMSNHSHNHRVGWITRLLPKFTGSGVLIHDDQTYDVKARIMWIGLDDNASSTS
jgi:predicted nicotinamide N-methyase